MSKPSAERLYNLLPAIYRLRDHAQEEPLRALLAVIESQVDAIQADIDQLYDNWFIETCAEWVVPYLGDLLAVRGVHPIAETELSQRGYVANTLAYRRRKGTAAVLEQLAFDITGWPARAVELFERLATTQHLNHLRPANLRTALRDANQLELLGTPFEQATYTADVRHIDRRRGKYNIPNVGLFLWRLQEYPIQRGAARQVGDPAEGRYTFSPLGYDAPLFNLQRGEREIATLAAEVNVPGMLRRRPLYDELEALRKAILAGVASQQVYFGSQPVLELYLDGAQQALPPDQIAICNLADWRRPTPISYGDTSYPVKAAVDPVLGRITFPAGDEPARVEVSYAYGLSGDVGGGPYNRQQTAQRWLDQVGRPVTFQLGVTQDQLVLDAEPGPTQVVKTLHEAVEAWHGHALSTPNACGIICILDSRSYHEALTGDHALQIPADCDLLLVGAAWPQREPAGEVGPPVRVPGELVAEDLRPHLAGDLAVVGSAIDGGVRPGALRVDGLLIEGALVVLPGSLGQLTLSHTTLVPEQGGLVVEVAASPAQQNLQLAVALERAISGPIALPASVPRLRIVESIVSSGAAGEEQEPAITTPGALLDCESCTIFGQTTAQRIEASNTIFTGTVEVERRQTGCVRFSFVPAGSSVPRRYHCQPDLAIRNAVDAALRANPALSPAEQGRIADLIGAWLRPGFSQHTYGHPAYAQLSPTCPEEIRAGAEDEAEMGVFRYLQQAQREANLRGALDEYLRVGLEAGIFFVT